MSPPPVPTLTVASPGHLSPHRLAQRVADHPVPPPLDPPLADEAPPRLTAFLYYVMRDLLPPRYMDHIASHVQSASCAELGAFDPGLADYADRLARRLMHGYGPTEDGQ